MASGLAWRDTYKEPLFVIFDAKILFLIVPTLLHVQYWTVGTVIVAGLILWFVNIRYNMNLSSALRFVRSALCGRIRPHLPSIKIRYPIDYGRLR